MRLLTARAVQALGSSGAIVLARAIVRDLYSGARAGRELSLMGSKDTHDAVTSKC